MKKKRKFIIILRGSPAVGKTTVAQLLTKKLHGKTAVLSIDRIARLQIGYSIETFGRELPYQNTQLLEENFLKKGFNVIIDDAFCDSDLSKKYFRKFFEIAKKNKARAVIVHLIANEKILLKRNLSRNKPPLKRRKILFLKKISSTKKIRSEILIDTSKLSKKEIVKRIFNLIKRE